MNVRPAAGASPRWARRPTLVLLLVVLAAVAASLSAPAPYVVLHAGPAPLFGVSGPDVQDPVTGRWVTATVTVDRVSYWGALWAALRSKDLRAQRGDVPSDDPVTQWQDALRTATGVAVTQAVADGVAVTVAGVSVLSVPAGSAAAAGGLAVGDVLTTFDGRVLRRPDELVIAAPGDHVLGVTRGASAWTVHVDAATFAGVALAPNVRSPQLDATVSGVGGSSAGLLAALAFYDALTAGDLTGGRVISATGVIAPDGSVGPVDGLAEKIGAVTAAGATVLLYPAQDVRDLPAVLPPGVRAVPVSSLGDALSWLCATGAVAPVCTTGH